MPFDNFFFKENILFGQNQKKKKKLVASRVFAQILKFKEPFSNLRKFQIQKCNLEKFKVKNIILKTFGLNCNFGKNFS